MRGLRAVTISRALAAPSGKDTDARNLIDVEPQGPGSAPAVRLWSFIFTPSGSGAVGCAPAPNQPARARVGAPEDLRLVEPTVRRVCALPETQPCRTAAEKGAQASRL
jgi:hypothetical protein